MEIFDKINDLVKNVGGSTNDALETTRLNSKIKEERAVIVEIQTKIGEYYYRKHSIGDQLDAEALELCIEMDKHYQEIAQAQSTIDSIKEKKEAAMLNKVAVNKLNENIQRLCTSCGTTNLYEASFCYKCGLKLEDIEVSKIRTCPSCGVEVKEDHNFCKECGTKI